MKTLYFRCKLLTDIVLNQRAATEGNQESLDFIPGNNFLGIVAGQLYNVLKPEESLLLFHSGKVRFGDAHPEKDNKRTLRIPASYYKGKLLKMEDGLYIHHTIDDFELLKKFKIDENAEEKDFQPKQCRTGFYLFENKEIKEEKVEKSFAIKSAYDRDNRRSKDEAMYGYESLQVGSSWIFEVTIEDEVANKAEQIKAAIIGTKRIGRSRTAQYGLVKIDFIKSEEVKNTNITPLQREAILKGEKVNHNYILIYADSRLIFLDEYGLPIFQPCSHDLGINGGEIIWEYSQIRTFQYAPWNFKRQARDTDRCGIEKGSILYVKVPSDEEISPKLFIGSYQNEGFGKVMYNPEFLQVEPNSNGKAKYKCLNQDLPDSKINRTKHSLKVEKIDDDLIKFLKKQNNQHISEQEILKKVNKFVAEHKDKYTRNSFASQWGTIRSIAMQQSNKQKLLDELFIDKIGYLVHGVSAEKWSERGRLSTFKKFIDDELKDYSGKEFQSALINLASEMAKISKGGK